MPLFNHRGRCRALVSIGALIIVLLVLGFSSSVFPSDSRSLFSSCFIQAPKPKAIVKPLVINLGKVEKRVQRLKLIVGNRGDMPIRVTGAVSYCKCLKLESSPDDMMVPPGESRILWLLFDPARGLTKGDFTKKIRITTDDPYSPFFIVTVKGILRE